MWRWLCNNDGGYIAIGTTALEDIDVLNHANSNDMLTVKFKEIVNPKTGIINPYALSLLIIDVASFIIHSIRKKEIYSVKIKVIKRNS